ncbi:MAG: hypothetical protein ACRCSQ_03120 [Bacteroidales bacterium]
MPKRILNPTLYRLFLCFLFASFYPHLFAQWATGKEGNLKGMVKSMKMSHLKIITLADSVWAEKAVDNDPFWFKGYIDEGYTFDKEGKTIEYHAYFTDDADDNMTRNIYDKSGRLIEQRYYADKRKTGSMTYEYNDEGKITFVTRYDENDKPSDMIFHIREAHASLPLHRSQNNIWIYTYDLNGTCKEEKCLFPDGRINFRHLFFYDEAGRQEKMVTFDGKNNQQSINSYKYDNDGRITSVRYLSNLKSTLTRFFFDDQGNEILCRIIDVDLQELPEDAWTTQQTTLTGNTENLSDEELKKLEGSRKITETRSVYTYDEQGNWTERYFYVNDEPQYMQQRIYTYWK